MVIIYVLICFFVNILEVGVCCFFINCVVVIKNNGINMMLIEFVSNIFFKIGIEIDCWLIVLGLEVSINGKMLSIKEVVVIKMGWKWEWVVFIVVLMVFIFFW